MLFVPKNIGRAIVKGGRELKRTRALLGSLVTLALAFSLAMAVPVYAADVGLTKGVTPATPNEYQLGDTINYTMSIINWSSVENVTVEAVWDVLPDGSTVYPASPTLPYTLLPGQTQQYTYDWVATRTGTVVNTFYAHGYQISTGGNDDFSESVEKSSVVIGREVGGTASLVNKVQLIAPWAGLLGCAAIVALVMLRRRRQA
jgi:uncharacterized repeat protein (TIGR01451 family)